MAISETPVIMSAMRAYKHPNAEDLILERLLYALSDPVRLEIVRHLAGVAEAAVASWTGGGPSRACPTISACYVMRGWYIPAMWGPPT